MIQELIEKQKNSIVSIGINWGIKDDARNKDYGKIFICDIPGYIKPLQIHISSDLEEEFCTGKHKIPEYRGLFGKQRIPTNAFFRPQQEDASKLKKTVKENRSGKNRNTSNTTLLLMQHMNAIINNNIALIPAIEDKQKLRDEEG